MVATPAIPAIPVNIITGFLGSGKTTLLAALLKRPDMGNTAVIINEFGDVGLDHHLIETSDETMVELASGCICCTIRGNLAETLCDLLERRRQGAVSAFERIVIETTGLAEPAPILQMLMNDPYLAENIRLDGIVATIDAVAGPATLQRHPEAVKQVAIADRLLLTKTDLQIGPPAGIEEQIRKLNAGAKLQVVINGAIAPADLFGVGLEPSRVTPDRLERWLGTGSEDRDHERHSHAHEHASSRHDVDINTFVIVREIPLYAVALSLFLEVLSEHCGQDLLRLKGLVNLAESPARPAVIHGVQHIFHPPVWLDAWPSDDHRSRIVLITRDVPQAWVEAVLDQLGEEVAEIEARVA